MHIVEAKTSRKQKHGKTKKKKSSTKKELNKKGQEKEGSDMDIFTKIEPPTTLPEKSARVEKTPQSNTPQPLTNNVNANNRQKNSSQSTKTESVTPVNFIEKDKSIPSNIPHSVTPPLPPRIADSIKTDKTENTALDKDANLAQKKYSVDFLLSMRDLPQCKERVNVQYPPVMASQDRSGPRGMSQNGFAPAGNSFLPQFMNPGNNMSLPPRKSQQGSMRRDNKPNPIHVSYSLREETPLRVSENAWRPKVLDDKSDEGSKTEALYKTARGLLNKLTPEKFPVIMEKFKGLHIDSNERLKGVIDLIFEKAVDEPGFCKWYAEMCSNMQEFNVAGEKDTKQSFRALLLNKCQSHFESTKADELDADKARVEMEMCTDPEKKKELRIVFEEKERKARRKNVGNCRFIGELFKFKMLTPKIMLNCIRVLISQLEEESLECLCKLLTTIGRDLDDKLPKEVDQFFKRLQDIADPKKKEKISSRIRFMILDVIDLRKNRWVPRRETDNPKTIDQMNMEMEKKEHEQRLANMTMRKSYDDYSRNRDSRKNRNDNQSEDSNWKVVTNRNSVAKINYKYDASKIASITAADTEGPSLGRPQTGTSWRLGAAGGAKKPTAPAVMDSSKSSSLSGFKNASGGKLTPSSSMERPKPNLPIRDDDTNKMSRSGSVQSVHPASREGSMQRTVPSRNASQTAPVPTPAPPTSVPLSDTQIALFSDTIFKEYVSNQSAKDTVDDFEDRFKHKDDREKAIVKFVEYALEKPAHIPACSKIVTVLLQANAVTVPTVANAASFLLEIGDDMKVDYPKFYEWMANILVGWPLLDKDCHLYNELKTALQRLPKNPDLEYLLQEIEKARRNDKDLIIEFLSKSIVINNNHDNVFKWINENVENPHNNPNLVKALTEAVCESLLAKKSKLEEVSEKFGKYFKKYIDNKETLELICLNTIVDFSRRKEHPQGLLLAMFEGLYDSKALSSDSYLQLRKNGKVEELGVAMMNLKNFYDYLENPETDE